MAVKTKRIQTDLRGNDVDKFKKHLQDEKEKEAVVLRKIVREYYSKVNTAYNE